ncbi:MAG: hypothetical protein J1E65_08105 [Lachnospiraceae bacterium]|nr:hypothetical protein [Lachnospiraceae bacterium]
MKTTIDKLLRQKEIPKEDTVYFLAKKEVNHFPITAGNFFQIETADKWQGESWPELFFQTKLKEKEEDLTYQELLETEKKIQLRIREMKEEDPKGYGHMVQLRSLRLVKHSIEDALQELRLYYQSEIEQEMKQVYGICNRKLLVYKNTVCLGSFEDLVYQIPSLKKVELSWICRMPLLLRNIESISSAVRKNIPIGLIGGPCLFGLYEIEIVVQHKDGRHFSYDFSSGRHYDRDGQKTYEFADHVAQNAKKIQSIHFINWKRGVTVQEQESLEVLFDVGSVLGAKVAVTIPDISYVKYLSTVIAPLDDGLKKQALKEFRVEAHIIADMYLSRIEELKCRYPDVEVKVLHERDTEACEKFYAGREAFFQNSGLIHRLTAKREKTDAVFDYISMLALPYYFWGTPQVIQIDNLDETDSYRKCRKVHKDAFSLSAILYPEKLCANGEQTIFNAPLEFKGYT